MKTTLARLYANENMPFPVVERLRELGHDVETSLESGRANQRISDADVLSYATEFGPSVLTLNRMEFHSLHKTARVPHAEIVTCTENPNFFDLADRIHDEIEKLGALNNLLVRVRRANS